MEARTSTLVVLGVLSAVVSCKGGEDHAESAALAPAGRTLEDFSFRDPAGDETTWTPGGGLRIGSGEARKPDALVIHAFQPDCPACLEQARELERLRSGPAAAAILGVAHRLLAPDVRQFAESTGAAYPLLLGTGSAWAERWGRGDSLYIVDRDGAIAYSQVGFHPSDPDRWKAVLQDLAAGRAARFSGPDRDAIVEGDRLPPIELPLVGGETRARLGVDEQGALVFEEGGQRRRFRAAVGFFSRY